MPRTKQTEETTQAQAQESELTRRRTMLMAAAEGCTQTALANRLVNQYWNENYANGPLDEVLTRQMSG